MNEFSRQCMTEIIPAVLPDKEPPPSDVPLPVHWQYKLQVELFIVSPTTGAGVFYYAPADKDYWKRQETELSEWEHKICYAAYGHIPIRKKHYGEIVTFTCALREPWSNYESLCALYKQRCDKYKQKCMWMRHVASFLYAFNL